MQPLVLSRASRVPSMQTAVGEVQVVNTEKEVHQPMRGGCESKKAGGKEVCAGISADAERSALSPARDAELLHFRLEGGSLHAELGRGA